MNVGTQCIAFPHSPIYDASISQPTIARVAAAMGAAVAVAEMAATAALKAATADTAMADIAMVAAPTATAEMVGMPEMKALPMLSLARVHHQLR